VTSIARGAVAGVLELIDDDAGPIDIARLPKTLSLRPRVGGERLRPGVRARTQTLKSLLQSARVPVERRVLMPLLFAGDRLVAAGDRWIDESIAAHVKSPRRARLKWTPAR
jgi:tRNA(Ile)-lysidine synthase